jgi:flavin reductase (DIM6/NTAB) family NADH-FMN oxidoreductase RutF
LRDSVDPDDLGPSGCYKLTSGLVVPRPIGWIGSVSAGGVYNLAPFSFFNMVAGWRPTVLFSPGLAAAGPKDTLANVQDTGEFTVNIVSEHLSEVMNATSASVAPGVDEFELTGLTPVIGDLVRAPMVGEALASMECRATQFVPVGESPRGAVVVFGEVVRFHLEQGLVAETGVDLDMLLPVGRLSGPGYTRTRDRFNMTRPS